jgi:hypothetical protein
MGTAPCLTRYWPMVVGNASRWRLSLERSRRPRGTPPVPPIVLPRDGMLRGGIPQGLPRGMPVAGDDGNSGSG